MIKIELILLPGNSSKNALWLDKTKKELNEFFSEIHAIYYQHWNSNEQSINFDQELNNLKLLIHKVENPMILAKSVGAILILKALKEKIILKERCILVGIPSKWCKSQKINLSTLLKGTSNNCYFIQNEKDPEMSFLDLKILLKKIKSKSQIFKLNGEDHSYLNTEEIKLFLKSII